METFRLLLNCVDHYQSLPTDLDPQLPHNNGASKSATRPRVPVIRVFGATETGQKVCAHIHGALPYFYIEYRGSLASEEVDAAIRTLHVSIDHALAVSYRRNPYDPSAAFVAYITLVKGVPFYGYHVGYRFFFKIYLLNPLHTTRVSDLLRQGAVMKRVLQPYESHLQYIPQWMCDYNLHGCSYINCSKVTFRAPVPSYSEIENPTHLFHDESISPELVSDAGVYPRQSHCALEVDIHVQDILNRHDIKQRSIHHDFVEQMSQMPVDEKLVPSLAELWEDEKRRRKAKMGLTDSESSPFSFTDLVSMSADARSTSPGGWIHEQEFREQVEALAVEERAKSDGELSAGDFVRKTDLEDTVKTALESVQELFPANLLNLGSDRFKSETTADRNMGNIEVDENRILSFGPDDTPFDPVEDINEPFSQAAHETQPQGPEDEEQEETRINNSEPLENGVSVSKKSTHSEAMVSVTEPSITSYKLETVGIRNSSELINSQEDIFEIDDDFISNITQKPMKRPSQTAALQPQSKKRKSRDNPATFPSQIYPSHEATTSVPKHFSYHNSERACENEAEPSSQTKSSQKSNKGGNSNHRIPFPVVKDPNDPATIWRLSQQSGQSKLSRFEPSNTSPSAAPKSEKLSFPPNEETQPDVSHTSSTNTLEVSQSLRDHFSIPRRNKIYHFRPQCPVPTYVCKTIATGYKPSVIYRDAYYSNENDVPDRAREYAGKDFKLESDTLPYLPPFDPTGTSPAASGDKPPTLIDRTSLELQNKKMRKSCSLRTWEFAPMAPTRSEVIASLKAEDNKKPQCKKLATAKSTGEANVSQIEGLTQKNRHGFKYSQKQKSSSVKHESNYMSVMSLEVHVNTRGTLASNPEEDEISCIFWCVQSEDLDDNRRVGILVLGENEDISGCIKCDPESEIEEEPTELDLMNRLVDIVRYHDPDILSGYEVHNNSWGYVIERARRQYDYDLCDELSRVKAQSHGRFGKETDRWGFNKTSSIRVTGRHMINIWRAMRGELNLLQYTMENVVFHLLHRRIPHYPSHVLTKWFKSGKPRDVAKTIKYFASRVRLNLDILDANELISRTSEQARVLGIDFFSVFSRGSQFKVESLMFRIAKPENLILISPSSKQVAQQNALECLPLVMEPQSDFYTSPLLVLDFQSLYPSVMIAYNYCYSTYLGRIVNWRGRNKMGIMDYQREQGLLELLKDHINIAPNGIMYAKQNVRKSLLAKMLAEILETRVMVKGGMKDNKDDRPLQRLLNNRQLALKLIANVTYGYTSASFSGRMPCSEIADSIVQTGRETLEKAIALIHSVDRWGAEVVYGDTDSLFIYLKGRTRDEAFDIGEDIVKTVTNANPQPVKLKFEKVYHPCVLLAKKRYVGYKYESRNQKEPEFDAKGIETVRRDGTPAEQKIEEKALKILFETSDLSRVKGYFQKQCTKIMQGKFSVQDFCFAKEVRLGTYSEKGAPPPGALISAKRMLEDPRLEPQYGERVPYVVVSGAPGSRLVDRCVAPEDLLQDPQLELDAEYYISKNLIPPLERIFNLVGANVRQWYDEMPKYQRIRRTEGSRGGALFKRTLESYMKSSSCVVCKNKLTPSANEQPQEQRQQQQQRQQPVCNQCLYQQPHLSLLNLRYRIQKSERKVANLHDVCRSCMGVAWGEEVQCDSKDCPVFYSRMKQTADLRHTQANLEPVTRIIEDAGDADGPLSW